MKKKRQTKHLHMITFIQLLILSLATWIINELTKPTINMVFVEVLATPLVVLSVVTVAMYRRDGAR